MRIVLKAHAKVNLDLRVLGRRADGYHDLRTVFQALALHDTLVIEPAPRQSLSLVGDASVMPLGEDNLAWKAAAALWHALGRAGEPRGARIAIRKRIPPQAGLGGGSSDAAATLVGLSRLWRSPLAPRTLLTLAATLGADVPFFLVGGTALGLGRGDAIYPLIDWPPRHVVVVRPAFGVPTKDAYAWLADARRRGPVMDAGDKPTSTDSGFANDFEPVVDARHPEILHIRKELLRSGANVARMSGTGSAVFGLFSSTSAAERAARRLAATGDVIVTRTLRRAARCQSLAAEWFAGGIEQGAVNLAR